MKRNQEGVIRPIDFFFVGLLFLLVIGGVIYFFRSNPTDEPAGIAVPEYQQAYDQASQQDKVYTSTVYGLSFLFPQDWQHEIIADQPVANVLHMVEARPAEALEAKQAVQVYVVEGESAEQAVNMSGILSSADTIAYNEVRFNSLPAYVYRFDADGSAVQLTVLEHLDADRWVIVYSKIPGAFTTAQAEEIRESYILIQESIRSFSGV